MVEQSAFSFAPSLRPRPDIAEDWCPAIQEMLNDQLCATRTSCSSFAAAKESRSVSASPGMTCSPGGLAAVDSVDEQPDETADSESETDSASEADGGVQRPRPPEVEVVLANELECAICLDLQCEPLRLHCGHSFCRSCMLATLTAAGHRRACPLCRVPLHSAFSASRASVDKRLEQRLLRACPEQYERKLKLSREVTAYRKPNRACPRVHFGNRHELVAHPRSSRAEYTHRRHRWTLFVELERIPDYLVRSVTFKLRPHLKDDVIRTCPPFEVMRSSWDAFPVEIVIAWKPELQCQPLVLKHHLSFSDDCCSSIVEVDLGEAQICAPFATTRRRPSAPKPAACRRGASAAGAVQAVAAPAPAKSSRFAQRGGGEKKLSYR